MERKTAASEEERPDKECPIYLALFPPRAYALREKDFFVSISHDNR